MNQQTRALYDKNIVQTRAAITQKPLKYMTNNFTTNRSLSEPHPEKIDHSTDLRMKPTRLNYYNRPEGELYGTAPMGALDSRSHVDVESLLRNSVTYHECNRTVTERNWDTSDYLDIALSVDTGLRPRSTRADLRNEYCNIGNNSFDVNSHHKK